MSFEKVKNNVSPIDLLVRSLRHDTKPRARAAEKYMARKRKELDDAVLVGSEAAIHSAIDSVDASRRDTLLSERVQIDVMAPPAVRHE